MSESETPPDFPALRCTRCGDEIEVELTYTGNSYSEHRDVTGFECYSCPARWDKRGQPLPLAWVPWEEVK